MDALAELLDGVRARGATFGRTVMDTPWAVGFASGAPLTLTTMIRGQAWVVPEAGEPLRLGQGDVAVVRGPHTIADPPGTAPQFMVTPGSYCLLADGTELGDELTQGPRTCGPRPDADALMLSGAYEGPIGERLLRALPPALVLPAGRHPALDLLSEEIAAVRPGQQVVLDRLLDLALVAALRAWFDRPGASVEADPVVDRALRLLHDKLDRPWTVADLAAETGVSRAALARRFAARVGSPPMAYLAGRRVEVAADLLRGSDATLTTIARRVGYSDAFALSVAFKRLRGVTPSEHRAAAYPA
ncbi:AraC family transcriptional regulator [Nonomuraea endophytica]|uniref:AraC-like DNA-binding protein n=1 Tax=Nonomuraea endophytica TaxID=714136 RepID=A0A7W8ADA2_9ACTN|nr:AraC family transcriptional regulator [Nonomuraea endophytica]MBB5082638.1 AraC-like DNA-binding protein [Nonomuraea endophytica]